MPFTKNKYLSSSAFLVISLLVLFTAVTTFSLYIIGQRISEGKSLEFITDRGENIASNISSRIDSVLSLSSSVKLDFSEKSAYGKSLSTEQIVELVTRFFNANDDSVNIEISINGMPVFRRDNMRIGADDVELMGQKSVNTSGVISSVSSYENLSKDNVYIAVTTQIDSAFDHQVKLSVSFWLVPDRMAHGDSSGNSLIVSLKNSDDKFVYGFIGSDDVAKIVSQSPVANSMRGYSIFKSSVTGDLDLFFVAKNNDFLIKHIDLFLFHLVIFILILTYLYWILSRYFFEKSAASAILVKKSLSAMEEGTFSISDLVNYNLSNDGKINTEMAQALSRHWVFLAKKQSAASLPSVNVSTRHQLEIDNGLSSIEQHISYCSSHQSKLMVVCLKIGFSTQGFYNVRELESSLRELIAVAVYDTKLNNGDFSIFMSYLADNFFEFIISIPNCSTPRHFFRIMQSVESKFESEDLKQIRSCAFGHSLYPNHGATPKDLIENAARSVKVRENDQTWIEERSRLAIIGNYFQKLDLSQQKSDMSILYHPIFNMESRRIEGVEALVRFNIPGIGILPSEKFIDIAGLNQKMYEIDMSVLRQSCADLSLLKTTGARHIVLSVNFSLETLRAGDCIDRVSSVLLATGFDAEKLYIEIPENVFHIEDQSVIQNICSLKKLGVSIVADNFYKNKPVLFSLNGFPVDFIKLDLSLLELKGDLDHYNLTVIEGIIATTKKLNICTVISGIESEAQYQALKSVGCLMAQGFILSEPVPAARLSELIKTNYSAIYDFK